MCDITHSLAQKHSSGEKLSPSTGQMTHSHIPPSPFYPEDGGNGLVWNSVLGYSK
jgi:hypothetical protein